MAKIELWENDIIGDKNMNINKFEYQIFTPENRSLSIYELARKNPKPINTVTAKVTNFWLYVCFSNDYGECQDFTVAVKDKARLAKKVENVVKSYCNNFGYAYVKTSSIRSARNKLAKEPIKSAPTDTTDKKELLYKIDKMEREIRKLKEQLSK